MCNASLVRSSAVQALALTPPHRPRKQTHHRETTNHNQKQQTRGEENPPFYFVHHGSYLKSLATPLDLGRPLDPSQGFPGRLSLTLLTSLTQTTAPLCRLGGEFLEQDCSQKPLEFRYELRLIIQMGIFPGLREGKILEGELLGCM
jgi:hypothetical protein